MIIMSKNLSPPPSLEQIALMAAETSAEYF